MHCLTERKKGPTFAQQIKKRFSRSKKRSHSADRAMGGSLRESSADGGYLRPPDQGYGGQSKGSPSYPIEIAVDSVLSVWLFSPVLLFALGHALRISDRSLYSSSHRNVHFGMVTNISIRSVLIEYIYVASTYLILISN
jgi:hypothetical protein